MVKKALLITLALIVISACPALADSGEIILKDTLYGGLIGGLLGSAWYLLDDDDAADKIGTGIGLGIIGGFILGITDVSAYATIENGEIEYAMPQIKIDRKRSDTTYTAQLLQVNF